MLKLTNYHLVLSGDFLEVYDYQFPMGYDFTSPKEGLPVNPSQKSDEEIEDNRDRSRSRAKKRIKRLVYANFGNWIDPWGRPYISKFLTLTFRDKAFDIKEANKRFTLFIKRLNYAIFKTKFSIIQYIAIIEIQPESKKIHYHVVLFNLPFIDRYYDLFADVWRNGYIFIEKIKESRRVAHYITKYITKEDDERLRGEKSFFCSRGLKKPIVLNNHEMAQQALNLIHQKPEFQIQFENEHTGKTLYRAFNISNQEELKKLIESNGRIAR